MEEVKFFLLPFPFKKKTKKKKNLCMIMNLHVLPTSRLLQVSD